MAKSVESPVFGKLKYSREYNQYETKMTHKDASISIEFDCESKDSIHRLLPFAEKVWKGRVRYFKAFREYANSDLLETFNGFMDDGQENPPELSATALREILRVPFTISFSESGNDDGELNCSISGGADPRLHDFCMEYVFTDKGEVLYGEVVALF